MKKIRCYSALQILSTLRFIRCRVEGVDRGDDTLKLPAVDSLMILISDFMVYSFHALTLFKGAKQDMKQFNGLPDSNKLLKHVSKKYDIKAAL